RPEVTEHSCTGGPAMVRAAANEFPAGGVRVSPSSYDEILEEIDTNGGLTWESRLRLARRAFEHTADYDTAISGWFAQVGGQTEEEATDDLPPRLEDVFI